MMNRRQFTYGLTCAAGSLTFARSTHALAAAAGRYDLIVKGGRVIDTTMRIDGVRDVAIVGGRIAAVEPNIAATADQTIDASGKIVCAGLIDVHTHCGRDGRGPPMVLQDGVTGWVDAGSNGADHIADSVAIAKTAPNRGRVLINIGRKGILPEGDTMDIRNADVEAAKDGIAKHRDYVIGVKGRLSRDVAGPNDYEVLRRAQEVATSFNLPVMIHMGQTISPIGKLVDLLKEGDIVTHMFAPPPNSIIGEDGRIDPRVLAARRRGVWFDVGNGMTGHMRWDTVEAIMKTGFWPDSFSTDWNVNAHMTGVIDMENCMSKLLGFGMTVPQAVARVTANPARMFEAFHGRGTLNVGAVADVALLDLREGNFEFVDNFNNKIMGKQRFFPAGAMIGGKQVARA